MEAVKRDENGGKRPYAKPEIKVEKIHRFFFATCGNSWPFGCYSQNIRNFYICL